MEQNEKYNQESDLNMEYVGLGIRKSVSRLNRFLFRCIRFFVKNALVLAIILILGVVGGCFIDSFRAKVYEHEIISIPNFGCTDYLYSKIDLIDSKIKEGDTVFLKGIGIQHPKNLLKIQISPIVDIFKFVDNGSDQNYKLLDLMAQDGDINKIMVEPATSKNYPYHKIEFSTKGMTSDPETVRPLMAYLNDNAFYRKVQAQYLANVQAKLKADDAIISQIDNFLNMSSQNGGKSNDKLVYYNENTQLNDVIKTKDELIREQGRYRIDLVAQDRIIKDNTVILNMQKEGVTNGGMKIVLPLLLLVLYLLGYAFVSFYRTQSRKEKNLP